MWLLNWLIAKWDRVWLIFEGWWWRVRAALDTYWSKLWNVVVEWWGAAYTFFYSSLHRLQDIILTWYGRIRAAVYDRWEILWQALSATWGFIWDHFFDGYRQIIDFVYSARVAIIDTYTRFGWEFAAFRANPGGYIRDRIPRWIREAANLVNYWYTQISDFFTNLYHRVRDFLSRAWSWLWEHFPYWVRRVLRLVDTFYHQVADFFVNLYHRVRDFLSRVWSWIYDHIPREFTLAWGFLMDFLARLKATVITFWDHLAAFLQDPYGYMTTLLQAWIEGWRDYIFGVMGDLLDQLIREVILHLMDWMGYVAFPIEDLDDMAPHFSPLTDWLEEVATAWRELKEEWVLGAMEMMEALAAELRGEEEMIPKRPSQIFWENWWLLPDDVRELINQPPIKG